VKHLHNLCVCVGSFDASARRWGWRGGRRGQSPVAVSDAATATADAAERVEIARGGRSRSDRVGKAGERRRHRKGRWVAGGWMGGRCVLFYYHYYYYFFIHKYIYAIYLFFILGISTAARLLVLVFRQSV